MSAETITALTQVFPLLWPEAILGVAACVLFVGATFQSSRCVWGCFSLVALAAAGFALVVGPRPQLDAPAAFVSPLWLDAVAVFVKAIAIGGGALLVLSNWKETPKDHAAEYFACLLLIVAGMCLVGSANELVTLFLALELISIPTYVLLYLPRHDLASKEAAAKYFLLSIFSSALLLFGFSYLYGLAGTTNLRAILHTLTEASGNLPAVAAIGLVMTVAGLGFRVAAVPFHFYAPDVYQGTTHALAGMLAFVPKVAGFAAMLRVLGFLSEGSGLALGTQVPILFWILAAVTMTLGNLLALQQDNLRRMLAYSSIAHAGYMLMGLAVAPYLIPSTHAGVAAGPDAVLFYLAAYGAMTIGAFGVLSYLNTPERPVEQVDDLAGLAASHPGPALLMALFLFSLIGMPPTAGFAGKLLLFLGALDVPAESAGQAKLFRILTIIAAVNAAIGGWYYLRVITVMYLRTTARPLGQVRAIPGLVGLVLCAILTLAAGVYPDWLWKPLTAAMPQAVPTTMVAEELPSRARSGAE